MDKENTVLQLRKDTLSFSMTRHETEFIFQSNPHEVPFINAIMYEVFVDLNQIMTQLKSLADPAEMQKDLFKTPPPDLPERKPEKKNPVLEKALSVNRIVMDLKADTKDGVIRELLEVVAADVRSGFDLEKCYHDLTEREHIVTTCMQNGVALPHARTDGTRSLVAAVGIRKSGYHFDSMDGKPTKLFILCASPRESGGSHIEFIAAAAAVVAKSENVERILSMNTPQEVYNIFIHS